MPLYGVGVGLRPTHHAHFLENTPRSVQWIEVISENFMPWGDCEFKASIVNLEALRRNYSVSLHGVSMNLGSVDDLDGGYLRRLKMLIERTDPFIVSDHLSFTGVKGVNMHDLVPLPYTEESLQNIAKKIDQVQSYLKRRIFIENPSSYFEYNVSEMSEVEFLLKLLKTTGAGLVLDINNIYVSSINHQFNPYEYLKQIPENVIGQIHLAGHSEMEGFLIDTHDADICDEVWSLYQFSRNLHGKKNVMIERDGNIPTWKELELELIKLGELYEHSTTFGNTNEHSELYCQK